MSFLVDAVKESLAPKKTIINSLRENLGGEVKARSHEFIHASDITKETFCPREVALLDLTKGERKKEYIAPYLRVIFDMGDTLATLLREKWLGNLSWGNWRCRSCGMAQDLCKKPNELIAPFKCKHNWEYIEVRFHHPKYQFSGGIDVFLDLGAPKLTMVEIKTMDKDQFAALAAPLAEHRIRTNLYMRLIEDSEHPEKHRFDTQLAKVIYIAKSGGKKHPDYGDEILPFKEFDVVRDEEALKPALSLAAKVAVFRKKGIIPPGICPTSYSPTAKSCSVLQPCFSGKYPASPLPDLPAVAISAGK